MTPQRVHDVEVLRRRAKSRSLARHYAGCKQNVCKGAWYGLIKGSDRCVPATSLHIDEPEEHCSVHVSSKLRQSAVRSICTCDGICGLHILCSATYACASVFNGRRSFNHDAACVSHTCYPSLGYLFHLAAVSFDERVVHGSQAWIQSAKFQLGLSTTPNQIPTIRFATDVPCLCSTCQS